MRISDWSSDVCSSDLAQRVEIERHLRQQEQRQRIGQCAHVADIAQVEAPQHGRRGQQDDADQRRRYQCGQSRQAEDYDEADGGCCPGQPAMADQLGRLGEEDQDGRSEEHTSELQTLMRISYAVFCLKKNMTNDTKLETI